MSPFPRSRAGISALLVAASALQPALAAQADPPPSEIAFARGLAERWGFSELAQSVVDGLEEHARSPRAQAELELLRCELFASAARRDEARRGELARRAVEGYRSFLARADEAQDLARSAEEALVRAVAAHARAERLELSSESRTEERAELAEWLRDAIARSAGLVEELRASAGGAHSEGHARRLHELQLELGAMRLDLALAEPDPAPGLAQARAEFEAVVESAGETSTAGLRAFAGLGEVELAQGRWEGAARSFQFVVDFAIPRDSAVWRSARAGMSDSELERRFLFVQLGTAGLVDALSAAGKRAEALAWGLHFLAAWKGERLELARPLGDLSALALARVLLGAGGWIAGDWRAGRGTWIALEGELSPTSAALGERASALDVALALAMEIEERNRGSALERRARQVQSTILELPGVELDARVLLDAGRAALAARDTPQAIERLERALTALERAGESERQELGSELLASLGRSYLLAARPLDAARTFVTALERHRGDVERDRANARELYAALQELRREPSEDPAFEELAQRAEALAAEVDPDVASALALERAERAYSAGQFLQAGELFAAVPAESPDHARARVFAGVCAFQLGELERAESLLDKALDEILHAPALAIAPEAATRRAETEATAVFYRALCAFELGERGGGAPHWSHTAELLEGFEERFGADASLLPAALYRLSLALDRLGRPDDAQRARAGLLARFPQERWTALAAAEAYRALAAQLELASDDATRRAVLRSMAESLRAVNSASDEPTYNNLKLEAGHWIELGAWAEAETVLALAAQRFGDALPEDVARNVLPKLGEALLRLERPAEAAAVLEPLVDGGEAARSTVQTWARALTGWVDAAPAEDGRAIEIRAHPGEGGELSFRRGIHAFRKLAEGSEPWSAEWLECEFDRLYAAFAASTSDPTGLEPVRTELELLAGEVRLGPSFEHANLTEPLRQKFLWLRERVR